MGKTKRKWIRLDYNDPDALRAEDIPYDAAYSIKQKIDAIPLGRFQSGRVGLTQGSSSVDVSFQSAFSDTNYTLTCTLSNMVDSNPSIYSFLVTNKSTTGFTVLFSGEIDSNNYYLEWMAS